VVLNPVRAGIVSDAGDWPWSSYGAMVGTASRPDWHQTDWVLGQFGDTRGKALKGYMDFVRDGVGHPGVWDSVRGQIYLGSESFVDRMQALVSDPSAMTEIPRTQRRPLAKPLEHYRDTMEPPKAAMAAAYATGDYTMQEIATCFGVHYATVSRAVRQKQKILMLDCKT
jgi:hypothetical protein